MAMPIRILIVLIVLTWYLILRSLILRWMTEEGPLTSLDRVIASLMAIPATGLSLALLGMFYIFIMYGP